MGKRGNQTNHAVSSEVSPSWLLVAILEGAADAKVTTPSWLEEKDVQDINSIIHFCLQHVEATVYRDPLPETKTLPSLYVPTPTVSDRPDTTRTYVRAISLAVKVFHHDSAQAFAAADTLADAVARARYLIPLIQDGGVPTGEFLRLEGTEFQVAEDGVAQLTLKWRNRFAYDREPSPKVNKFILEEQVKEHAT